MVGCFVTGSVCLELILWSSLLPQHCNLRRIKSWNKKKTICIENHQYIVTHGQEDLLVLPFCFSPLGGLAGAAFTTPPTFPPLPPIMPTTPGVVLTELGGTWGEPGATLCPGTKPKILPLSELWAGLEPSKPSPVPAPLVVTPLEPEVGMEVLSTEMLDCVVLLKPRPPDAAAWAYGAGVDPEMSPAIVFKEVGWPPRPKPVIWLALLVPVMPPLLNPIPNPSPKLDTEVGPEEGCDWELGTDELGVLGVGREGAVEAGRRGLLGGLGVFEGTEGFVWGGCCCCCCDWFGGWDCCCCCAGWGWCCCTALLKLPIRLLLVGTAGMPPTTLAMDTREEDEEDPEVVEEEKEDSKDGVPFFTGDCKWQSIRERHLKQNCPTGSYRSIKCLRSKVYCHLWSPKYTGNGTNKIISLQPWSHRENISVWVPECQNPSVTVTLQDQGWRALH